MKHILFRTKFCPDHHQAFNYQLLSELLSSLPFLQLLPDFLASLYEPYFPVDDEARLVHSCQVQDSAAEKSHLRAQFVILVEDASASEEVIILKRANSKLQVGLPQAVRLSGARRWLMSSGTYEGTLVSSPVGVGVEIVAQELTLLNKHQRKYQQNYINHKRTKSVKKSPLKSEVSKFV